MRWSVAVGHLSGHSHSTCRVISMRWATRSYPETCSLVVSYRFQPRLRFLHEPECRPKPGDEHRVTFLFRRLCRQTADCRSTLAMAAVWALHVAGFVGGCLQIQRGV